MSLIAILGLMVSGGASSTPHAEPSQLQISEPAISLLGEQIFNDTSLSHDGKVSCASCHRLDHAHVDRDLLTRPWRRRLIRNAPSLSSELNPPYLWDGRAANLEDAVMHPFTGSASTGLVSRSRLLRRLSRSPFYRIAFRQAFPDQWGNPSLNEAANALAAYIRNFPRERNAFDDYQAGDEMAMPSTAKRGLALFEGTAHCNDCHRLSGSPASLTDFSYHPASPNGQLAPRLADAARRIANLGSDDPRLDALIASDPAVSELGRYVVTRNPADIGLFRTPSLRNVAATAPYMHDGSTRSLSEAVDREVSLRTMQSGHTASLTEQDRRDLIAFLECLTDRPIVTVSESWDEMPLP